jgi:polyisoprenoid-binding protein YceI
MRWFAVFVALLLPTVAVAADVSVNPQSAPKGSYTVEPKHTIVMFCIRHMGISNYCGRFNNASGKISFNGAQPAKSTATVEVRIDSLDTPSDELDKKLLADFFEATKFPTAKFVSKSVKVTGNNAGVIDGDLTLHGQTRPVSLATTFNGGKTHPFANTYVIGFSARTTIRLDAFSFPDVSWKGFVGDEVELIIESEFLAEK